MIKLTVIEQPAVFFEKTKSFLSQHEAENNLIIGLTKQLIDSQPGKKVQPFYAVVEENNKIVLAAMMNPSRDLILSSSTSIPIHALQELADYIWQFGIPINGVNASNQVSQQFSAIWSHRAAVVSSVIMEELIYRLECVNYPKMPKGSMRNANLADFYFIAEWMSDFHKEALNEPLPLEEYRQLELRIKSGNVYVWEDGVPVSMAMKNRATVNGAVIGYVFTPYKYRGNGYGSAISAAISAQLLENGYKFCALYTDAANKTSNTIYKKIGYKVLSDISIIRFSNESEEKQF